MKGLLIKDFCLLRNQNRTVPIFLVLAVWFAVMNQITFCISFLTMMSAILAMSTCSYDELDNCQTHLFAMPFDRKTYATGKFVLGVILLVAALALAFLSCLGRQLAVHDVNMPEVLQTVGICFFLGLIFISIMVPLRIRFPGDQGRIAIGILMGVGMLSAAVLSRAMPNGAEVLATGLAGLSLPAVFALLAALTLVIIAISYTLSVRWIRKKEF